MKKWFCIIICGSIITAFPSKLHAVRMVPDNTITTSRHLKQSVYESPYSFTKNTPNYSRLATNSGIILGSTVVVAGIFYTLPESFTKWDRSSISLKTLGKQWWNNVSTGPVIDKDDLFLNWVAHPYFGGVYYMTARSAGFNAPYSFLYSFVASTLFWEYGIEAFAEIPSIQDLIITPVIGSILGEGFYLVKRAIVNNDYRLLNSKVIGYTLVFLMDPLNELTDYIGGGHYARQSDYSLQLTPLFVSLRINF